MKQRLVEDQIVTAVSFQGGWLKLLQAKSVQGKVGALSAVKAARISGMQEKEAADLLKQMIASLPFPAGPAVLLFPNGETFSRYLKLPSTDPSEFRSMALYQLEGALPYSVQECVVSAVALDSDEDFTKVLAVAAPRQAAERMLAICRQAGLEISRIGVSSEAVGRWHGACRRSGEDLPDAVRLSVELMPDGLDLAVFSGGSPIYMRQVPQSSSDSDEIVSRIAETAQAYARERVGPPIERVTLSGSPNGFGAGLEERLEQELHVPVSRIDPLEFSPFGETLLEALRGYSGEVSFTDLLGAVCEPRLLSFDLLPAEAKQQQALAALAREGRRAAIFAGAVLLILSVWAGGRMAAASLRIQHLEQESQRIGPAAARVEKMAADLSAVAAARIEYHSRLEVLHQALSAMPSGMQIRNLVLQADGTLLLSGSAPDLKAISSYAVSLKNGPHFKNVLLRSARARASSADGVEFELSLEADRESSVAGGNGTVPRQGAIRKTRLSRAERQLGILRGWMNAEQEISAAHRRIFSQFPMAEGSDKSWAAMEGFQETAQAAGISLSEISPGSSTGEMGREPQLLRWEMKLAGDSQHLTDFFKKLPDRIPGIRMEQLQLGSPSAGQVQCLLRVSLEDRR